MSFAKNMGKNTGKNISKNLTGKYSKKRFDHAKKSATDAFKITSESVIQKIAKVTGNKVVDRITKVSKTSQQNNSETTANEHNKEIPKERYISLEERLMIRLI